MTHAELDIDYTINGAAYHIGSDDRQFILTHPKATKRSELSATQHTYHGSLAEVVRRIAKAELLTAPAQDMLDLLEAVQRLELEILAATAAAFEGVDQAAKVRDHTAETIKARLFLRYADTRDRMRIGKACAGVPLVNHEES